jgi:hypothetical protein
LIDAEIGEIGVTEEHPATWVEAEVGSEADRVTVQFADGSTDSTTPTGGVAVLAHLGDASTELGDGNQASLKVFGANGVLLASYAIGVDTSTPSPQTSPPPSTLPKAGSAQPANPTQARGLVRQALSTALSCSEPPVLESQAVTDRGAFEEIGGAGAVGLAAPDQVTVRSVVFTSAAHAVVEYQVQATTGARSPLYAAASLVDGSWLISLPSLVPGLQVAPANQDGDVAVAPGGPLFVHTGAGGVAIAVYRAASTENSTGCDESACSGAPTPSCEPTGGIVEEITTPGAIGIESEALFGADSTPVVDVGLSIVGEAEGSPATVLSVEVGAETSSVLLTLPTTTVSYTPAQGVVDTVLAGAPSHALGPSGASLTARGTSGATLGEIPLAVDAAMPPGASSLPSSLPTAQTAGGPADPASATAAIEQVIETVFNCATPPLVRSEDIEDNGLFSNAFEELYAGPSSALIGSSYATVSQVVFTGPTQADVSYTIRFHDDPGLSFPEIGTVLLIAGSWKVSYATLCSAVALGGVSCGT